MYVCMCVYVSLSLSIYIYRERGIHVCIKQLDDPGPQKKRRLSPTCRDEPSHCIPVVTGGRRRESAALDRRSLQPLPWDHVKLPVSKTFLSNVSYRRYIQANHVFVNIRISKVFLSSKAPTNIDKHVSVTGTQSLGRRLFSGSKFIEC